MIVNTELLFDEVAYLRVDMLTFVSKCDHNCSIDVWTGLLNPENMGKDTKIDFLSQIDP